MVDTFPKVEIQKILYLMITVSQAQSGIFYLPGEERIIISKSSKMSEDIPEFDHFIQHIGTYHNIGLKMLSERRNDIEVDLGGHSDPEFYSLIFSFAISECNFAMVILFKDQSKFSLYNQSILTPHIKLIQKRIPHHNNFDLSKNFTLVGQHEVKSDS